MQYIDTRYK